MLRSFIIVLLLILLKVFADPQLPDLAPVKPLHVNYQVVGGREFVRFSNGIANIGRGPLAVRSEVPITQADRSSRPNAIQLIADEALNTVDTQVVSQFEFHPEHNHWHIGEIAHYEVRKI